MTNNLNRKENNNAPEPNTPMVADTANTPMVEKEARALKPHRTGITIIIFTLLAVIATAVFMFLFGEKPTPAEPSLTPAVVEEEELNPHITELLELREHASLKEVSLFTCHNRDGVWFLNKQPEDRQLYQPVLSITDVAGGGVSVSFGDPECVHPVVLSGELTDDDFVEAHETSIQMMEEYDLPLPSGLEDGQYVVQTLALVDSEDTPITYAGVASVAVKLKQVDQPKSNVHDPRYADRDTAVAVASVLDVLAYADEETLRSLIVDDSVLKQAVEILSYTVLETERLA